MLYKQVDETNFNRIYLNVIIMNRLEENQIIAAINSSFYKNVFLLTQVLPPSSEFQQCFKKNMFDKPNTMGFLHVSHYLSVIYDSQLFKQMVSWPVLCKRDEVKYRTEIKDLFFVLSQDNPDINFPPVLISHLIQSGGTRFLIIMWKLSQLALRAYIKKKSQEELLHAPRTSPMDDLTITYFNNIIAEKHNVMMEIHKKTKRVLDAANNFLNNEIKILSVYKSEIFDRRENLRRLVSNLLTYPLIQEQLMNVEDSKIISLWKIDILKKIQYIRKKNEKFEKLEKSCNRLCKLIVGINSNSEILDANKFSKINYDNYLHLNCNLYADGSIILSALLSLLYVSFIQMQYRIKAANFPDLSPCLLHIQNTCKNIKVLKTLFTAMNTRISNMIREECVFREIKNISANFDTNIILTANRYVFLESPKIDFNLNQCLDDDLYEKLSLSPIRDKYKYLFKKYKYCPSSMFQGALSDFSSSWNNMSGWLSPRAHSIKCEQIIYNGKLLSPLYSRLLQHSELRLKRSIDNTSCSSNMSYEGLNITPKKRRSISKHLMKNSHGETAKNLFNFAATQD